MYETLESVFFELLPKELELYQSVSVIIAKSVVRCNFSKIVVTSFAMSFFTFLILPAPTMFVNKK